MTNDDQNIPATSANDVRPGDQQIGLALGGGVARGWAHIGVLRRLDELGIRPQIIAGTSIGAVVSGFWLAGKLDILEDWARSFTKKSLFTNFDLVLNGAALMGGKRLRKTMTDHLGDAFIEELPGRLIIVATELVTGHEIWLRHGRLVDAIEASYALPGVFPPRAINGRWLIDGALVNPMPVSVARAMGARLVIAVGLHADSFGRASVNRREKFNASATLDDEMMDEAGKDRRLTERMMIRRLFKASGPAPGLGATMLASFNIVMDRITRSRLAGDPPDVQIMPQCGHVGLLEFDRADELINTGREAVDYAMPRIEAAMEMLK